MGAVAPKTNIKSNFKFFKKTSVAAIIVFLYTLHSIVSDMRSTRSYPFTDRNFYNLSLLRCYAVSTGI